MSQNMNYSTAICLVNDSVKGVACSFEINSIGEPLKLYTFKNLGLDLKVKDLVMVPTKNNNGSRHGFSIVRVEELDVEIPLEDDIEYKWIACKFDLNDYLDLLDYEKELIAVIKSAEKNRRRSELRASVMADVADKDLPQLPGTIIKDDGINPEALPETKESRR